MEQEYEVRPSSPNTNRQVLAWKHVSISCDIAVNEDMGKLDRLRHMELREEARGLPALQAVVEAFQELFRLKAALERGLRRIEHLALFPGSCELCSS
jgi:hypothetical protein